MEYMNTLEGIRHMGERLWHVSDTVLLECLAEAVDSLPTDAKNLLWDRLTGLLHPGS